MTHREYKETSGQKKRNSYLEAREAATRRQVESLISTFCRYVGVQQKKFGRRWPFDFTPDKKEMELLVDYLFHLRAVESAEWMRGPWVGKNPGPQPQLKDGEWLQLANGERVRSQLANSSDDEPANFGEQFVLLQRKYWKLVFGYRDGGSKVPGIGRTIFEAAPIDDLDVGLLIRQPSPNETLEDVEKELKHAVRKVNRSLTTSPKKQTETIRQRIRDLDRVRRK